VQLPHVPPDRSPGVDGGQRSRSNRTGEGSDHGGTNHLSGDPIVRLLVSESQEFVDELSLTAFTMARHPAQAHPPLVWSRGGNREPSLAGHRLGATRLKPEGTLPLEPQHGGTKPHKK